MAALLRPPAMFAGRFRVAAENASAMPPCNTDIDHWFTNGRTSSYLHDKHLDARPSCATTRATVKT